MYDKGRKQINIASFFNFLYNIKIEEKNKMELEFVIKMLFINIITYIIGLKIINKKQKNYIKIIVASIVTTILYLILRLKIKTDNLFATMVQFMIQLIFLRFIIKEKNQSFIITNLLANAITYIGFVISAVLELTFKIPLKIQSNIINTIIISIIETMIMIFIFRMKRLKNGFSFLNKANNEYFDIIIINISSVIIFTYCLFGSYYGSVIKHILSIFIVLTIIMFIMIQKTLNLYYRHKLLVKAVDDSEIKIKEKDEQIKKLSDEKFKISKLNHEFYNRQKALEEKVNNFVMNSNMEISGELSILQNINKLSNEYSSKLEEIKNLDKLPLTDIEEVDDMFKYMQSECLKNNIDFNLKINGNIHYMVNNIIAQDKLVTLIGDHIRDAIIAINSGTNLFRSILVMLGKKNNCYEFCVYDTGIEFEIDTLIKLGIEPATTHKETGGTGIGFITTFETMKETKSSLIISENKVKNDDYTKSVTIRFDGKNEYKIYSYRADEIKNKDIENRIIIENKDSSQ